MFFISEPTPFYPYQSMRWISASRKKASTTLEERSFIENGSHLLEATVKSRHRKHSPPIQIFSKSELEIATDNYNHDQIFHREGPYDLYKGWHQDKNISVKKFKGDFICARDIVNEVVIASQMRNHKNVLKLLGCCLETQLPVLVYEFASNGNLSDYIVKKRDKEIQQLSWEKKLQIAIEIAYAIAYLHMSESSPIIHRGIKPYNISLDHNYVAKLPGFTFSLMIPPGETRVQDEVIGAFGYIAPESGTSGWFTVKSDVYSFGAVLVEMVTGNSAIDIHKEVYSMTGNSNRDQDRDQCLKAKILIDGNLEQVMACKDLALLCLKENSAERPRMREVVIELRRIQNMQLTSNSRNGTSQL